MNRILFFLAFLFCFSLRAQIGPVALGQVVSPSPLVTSSSVHPVQNEALNYTQIIFEYPQVKGAETYVVSVFTTSDAGDTVPVFSQQDSTNATLIEGFEFGRHYAWYYVAFNKSKKKISQSGYFSFRILPLLNNYRVSVKKNAAKNDKSLVAFDNARLICDRTGKIVWFMNPTVESGSMEMIRDLRIDSAGVVTYISSVNAYATALDGRIVWKAPDANRFTHGTTDFYHSSLKRLPSGNYLVLGTRHEKRQIPGDTAHVIIQFGTILEIDQLGKIVWSWDSGNYLTDADLFNHKLPDGKPFVSAGLNAVHMDDSAKFIYAGFGNLNRIIKIEKKTGRVVSAYEPGLFWHQNDLAFLPDGSIAVYNNDSIADAKKYSSVVLFSPPSKAGEETKLLWKFSCKLDSFSNGKTDRGGNVELLPNGNFLIGFGSANRCAEVGRDKKIYWDAFVEQKSPDKRSQIPLLQYRAHYVSSLYPCYFTAAVYKDSLSQNPNGIKVIINNEGSNADSYFIDCSFGKDSKSPTVTTKNIAGGKNSTTILSLPGEEKNILVKVRSRTNPDFVREFHLN